MYRVEVKLNEKIDQTQVGQIIKQWLSSQVDAKAGGQSAHPKFSRFNVPVVMATVQTVSKLEATVGTFDSVSYDRDLNYCRAETQKAEARGSKLNLKYPDKEKYFRKENVEFTIPCNFKTKFDIQPKDTTITGKWLKASAKSAVASVDTTMLEDDKAYVSYDEDSYPESEITRGLSKQLTAELKPLEAEHLRKFDKVYKDHTSTVSSLWKAAIAEVPMFMANYEHNGKPYQVVVNGLTGDVVEGTYPIDVKAGFMIVTKWVAAACAAAFVWMRILEPMIFA